jgi:hypothetical protein
MEMIVDLVVIAVIAVISVAMGAYAIAREVRYRKRMRENAMRAVGHDDV